MSTSSPPKRQRGGGGGAWSCATCTFANDAEYLACSMCGTEMPSAVPLDLDEEGEEGRPSKRARRPSSSGEEGQRQEPKKRQRHPKAEVIDTSDEEGDATEQEDEGGEGGGEEGDDTQQTVGLVAALYSEAGARAFRRACKMALRAVERLEPRELRNEGACASVAMDASSSAFQDAFAGVEGLPEGERQDAFSNMMMIVQARLGERRARAAAHAPSRRESSAARAFDPTQPLPGSSVNDVFAFEHMDRGVDALYRRIRAAEFASAEEVELEVVMLMSSFFSAMQSRVAPGEPSVEQRAEFFRRTTVRRLLEYAEEAVKQSTTTKERRNFLFDWLPTGDDVRDDVLLVDVLPDSAEFGRVCDLFCAGNTFRPSMIVSLRRVQNPANRERFLTQRATMVRACPPPVESPAPGRANPPLVLRRRAGRQDYRLSVARQRGQERGADRQEQPRPAPQRQERNRLRQGRVPGAHARHVAGVLPAREEGRHAQDAARQGADREAQGQGRNHDGETAPGLRLGGQQRPVARDPRCIRHGPALPGVRDRVRPEAAVAGPAARRPPGAVTAPPAWA